jgi:hypothetical protein
MYGNAAQIIDDSKTSRCCLPTFFYDTNISEVLYKRSESLRNIVPQIFRGSLNFRLCAWS